MKKLYILLLLATFGFSGIVHAQTWEDILAELEHEINDKPIEFEKVLTKTVEVNSLTKWGGDTRKVIPFSLPTGTEGWYYRITPMYVSYDYSYGSNETLYYLIKNKAKSVRTPPFGDYAIVDCYVFTHSADAYRFDAKSDFNYMKGHAHKGIATSYYYNNTVQDNLWIGIKNPNNSKGLKVIVEVVAWGSALIDEYYEDALDELDGDLEEY
jgi:hypothetical protein